MFPNPSLQAYTQTSGTTQSSNLVINQRDPTSNDIYYPIGKFWLNQAGIRLWYLNKQSNVITLANHIGAIQSTWELISVSSLLASISDTSNTPVFPSSSSATPPDNIQLVGANGVSVTSNPTSNLLTISGTGTLAESFVGNTGTATPLANVLNVVGVGSVVVTASGNTLSISDSGGAFTWSDVSGAFAAVSENGYFITGTSTGTLPSSAVEGTTIKFIVDTTSNLTIQANTGQHIRISTKVSAATGIAVNTQQGDSVSLVYRLADTTWISEATNGGWNIT